MTMVRGYLLCTQSALRAVQDHCEAALDAWLDGWFGQGRPERLGLQCRPLEADGEPAVAGSWRESRGPWGHAWIHAEAAPAVAGLVFGARSVAAGSLASDVGGQAIHALLQAVTGSAAPAVSVDGLPACVLQPGRQSMRVDIRVDDWTLALIVRPAAAQGPALAQKGGSPLGRLDQALAAQPLRLEVCLGEAEIELGALQDLSPGDIIRLERRLDEPAELVLFGQTLTCKAYLGTSDGQAAIEIGR